MAKNKGEWSELYVLLSLLSSKEIYRADDKMSKIDGDPLRIKHLLRRTQDGYVRFRPIAGYVQVIGADDICQATISYEVIRNAVELLRATITSKGDGTGSIEIPQLMPIIENLGLRDGLSSDSRQKTDIEIAFQGHSADETIVKGYSIKSFVGSPPTLLNASGQTKISYIISPTLTERDVIKANLIDEEPAIARRLQHVLVDRVVSLSHYHSMTFYRNLLLLDVGMPDLLASLTLAYFSGFGRTLKELTEHVADEDTLQLQQPDSLQLYKFKVKHLISEVSVGLTPGKVWNGETSVSGGIIVVNKHAEVLCYEADDRDQFREYLYSHLRFETPSKSRHGFGLIFNSRLNTFIDLCIQLRF